MKYSKKKKRKLKLTLTRLNNREGKKNEEGKREAVYRGNREELVEGIDGLRRLRFEEGKETPRNVISSSVFLCHTNRNDT